MSQKKLSQKDQEIKDKLYSKAKKLMGAGIALGIVSLLASHFELQGVAAILWHSMFAMIVYGCWIGHKGEIVGEDNPKISDIDEVSKDPKKLSARLKTATLSALTALFSFFVLAYFLGEDSILQSVGLSFLFAFLASEIFGRIFEPESYKR